LKVTEVDPDKFTVTSYRQLPGAVEMVAKPLQPERQKVYLFLRNI